MQKPCLLLNLMDFNHQLKIYLQCWFIYFSMLNACSMKTYYCPSQMKNLMPFSVSPNTIVDNLRNEELGYGFLSDCGFQKEMDIMKVFMSYPKFKDCFYIWEGNKLIWATDKCNRWLAYVEEFKELIYVLVHFLRGRDLERSTLSIQICMNV